MSHLLDTATSGPRFLNTCHRFSFSFQTPDNYVHSTLSIPLKGDPLSFERKPFDTSDVISTLERSSVRSLSQYQVMRTAAIFAAEGRPEILPLVTICQFSAATWTMETVLSEGSMLSSPLTLRQGTTGPWGHLTLTLARDSCEHTGLNIFCHTQIFLFILNRDKQGRGEIISR